ncbi:OmpH family outer membrane protein [Bacteroidota bacterium]
MKKYSGIINIILLIAVVILYFFHFSGESDNDAIGSQTVVQPQVQNSTTTQSIVFVNVDSLLANYLLYTELTNELIKERESMEAELSRKTAVFEKEVQNFQDKVEKVLITRANAKIVEAELTTKQQDLLVLKDSMANKLIEDEQSMNLRLHDNIIAEINEYNKTNNYQFVLSKTFGGSILFGNGNLDITKIILDRLNEKYTKSK